MLRIKNAKLSNTIFIWIRTYPANISMSVQRCFQVDMTSRRRTTSNHRWSNVVYVNVEIYDLFISTLNWTTLGNFETTLCISTSVFTTLGNVETTLPIRPFHKKINPRFKSKLIFLSFKEYAGLKIFFIFSPF